jgi:hypothetical protein
MTKLEQAQRTLYNNFSSGGKDFEPIPQTIEGCQAIALQKLERDIKIQQEILDSDISSPFRRAFIEGRLEGLQVALNLLKGLHWPCSKVSEY